MRFAKTAQATPIPGYRLLEPLGSGGFGEVWKCEAPGGLCKAIKFVYGNPNALDGQPLPAAEELKAIQHIKAIRHPFILSLDRVEVLDGDLVIVMELADRSLHDLLVQYREAGQPGIPRDELLGYLREAAEALDLMNAQYGLQHLDVKPRNLFLVSNHVKVADFGLVNSHGREGEPPPALQLGAITPLYAAPEAFSGAISRHCDQYSLAIVYQELLTGTLPHQGQNVRQLLLQHTQGEPDLGPLPETDRLLVARALAKDPAQRFASCTDFIRALLGLARQATSLPPNAGTDPSPNGLAETVNTPSALETTPVPRQRRRDDATTLSPGLGEGMLPGYRLLNRLRSNLVSEIWKAQAADGRARHIKLLYGFARSGGQSTDDAIARLASLQHPALTPLEMVQHDPGRLVVATDPVETTLWDRCRECQAQSWPGVPRRELLGYLRTAAEVLDHYAEHHDLQHLGLNPRAFALEDGRLRLMDFGLAQLLWAPAGQPLGQLNARYAAPELFDNTLSRGCDQYSLALIYQEMLTGAHPFRGQARGRGPVKPDLERLPPGDRALLARALEREPQQRWPSCTELVRALETASQEMGTGALAGSAEESAETGTANPPLRQILTELLAAAAVQSNMQDPHRAPLAAGGDSLKHRFQSRLTRGAVRQKLDQFRQQWNGQLVRDDEEAYVFQVLRSLSFWQRCIGKQAGLEVELRLLPAANLQVTSADVALHVKPFGCGSDQGAQLLNAMGPLLLESGDTCLQAMTERRVQKRLAWPHPLRVRFVLPNQELGEPVACRGKDIALTGIGFYLPPELPTQKITIELTAPFQPTALTLPANIIRVQRRPDGWYEVGASFA